MTAFFTLGNVGGVPTIRGGLSSHGPKVAAYRSIFELSSLRWASTNITKVTTTGKGGGREEMGNLWLPHVYSELISKVDES